MPHEHGDVPGPTTHKGERPANSAQPGEQAAESQASPPAPLGYGEEASENLGTTTAAPNPAPEKFYNPSEGESATRTNAPPRGGGYLSIPGEDS
ncbi:MAG: hypothetical protein M3Y58_17450 [Chloroflexota bacterium]|nr:hypothetical protein [Chloroflexota bacterium]